MRKITAIVLLVLFASTSEVGQVLKLPLLISHYIDHYREERQSVYAFFHEHYVHHHGSSNNDQDEDNQLPFKTTHFQQTGSTYLLPAYEAVNGPAESSTEKKLILPSSFILADFLKDIFHPPKIA